MDNLTFLADEGVKALGNNQAYQTLFANTTRFGRELLFYTSVLLLMEKDKHNPDRYVLNTTLEDLSYTLGADENKIRAYLKVLKLLEVVRVTSSTSMSKTKHIIFFTDTINENKMQITQTDLFPKQKSAPKKKESFDGYYAKEYAKGGKRADYEANSDFQKLIQYYMKKVYEHHDINYYIPKTNIPKYYKRAQDVIKHLENLENALNYVNWFLKQNSFESSGYSLDLLVSTSVLNKYKSANIRDKNSAKTEEMPDHERTISGDVGGKII